MSNILCYDSQGKYLKRLYQWDTNQTITFHGVTTLPAPIFHFTKSANDEALVVTPSVSTDTVRVDIPNILLQTSGTLYVYMVEVTDADGDTDYEGVKTTHLIKIPIIARPQPADYEYEENIDYDSIATLSARLSGIIAGLSNADDSSMAAEVIDMRTPNEGTAYSCAGDYIRAIDTRLASAEAVIETKANATDVTAALATKANASDVTEQLAAKANASDMTAALATKANASDMETALALKANVADVDAALDSLDHEIMKFTTRTAADTYLSSEDAAAGQVVLISETANDKFKLYLIETGTSSLQYEQVSAGSYIGASLPSVANGDPDKDYYIGSSANGYVHYRFINGAYVAVGGDSYSKSETYTKAEVDSAIANATPSISFSVGFDENDIPISIVTSTALANGSFPSSVKYIYVANTVTAIASGFLTSCPNVTNIYIDNTSDNISVASDVSSSETVTIQYKGSFNATDVLMKAINYLGDQMDTALSNLYTYRLEYGAYQPPESEEELADVLRLVQIDMDDNETVKSYMQISGSSSGGSSNMAIRRITQSPMVVAKGDTISISINFSNVDNVGDPIDSTYAWKVDGTTVMTGALTQEVSGSSINGVNTFDLTDYVTPGTHKLTITCSDGRQSASKDWKIQVIDLTISTDFSDEYARPAGNSIIFPYTPTGTINKVLHFVVDGDTTNAYTETIPLNVTNTTLTHTVPASLLTHGSHFFDVYLTANVNGTAITSNHIYKDVACYDDSDSSNAPIISCPLNYDNRGVINVNQYETLNIKYVVYDINNEAPTVNLTVDSGTPSEVTATNQFNIWSYRADTTGSHTLTISCGSTSVEIHLNVIDLGYDIAPVTESLVFDFNPVGLSNSSANRLWEDENNSSVKMTVSENFDWNNGGYVLDDDDNPCFCVKAGSRAYFSYNLFGSNPKESGSEFKIIFRSDNIRSRDAQFLSCMPVSDATQVGLEMNVHEAYLHTTEGAMKNPYCDGETIEFEYNISPIAINDVSATSKIMTYEDGVAYRPQLYTNATRLHQLTPSPITIGSDDCDIYVYRMKAYSSALTDANILSNFIADARDSETMINRFIRNQLLDDDNLLTPESVAQACPDLKIIKLDVPIFTLNKKDYKVANSIECIHTGGDPILDNWKATRCYHVGQGTTSDTYGDAGRNLNIYMNLDGVYNVPNKDGGYYIPANPDYKTQLVMGDSSIPDDIKAASYTTTDGTGKVTLTRGSLPNNIFNIKVNIASSENTLNALLQKRYNDFLPYESPARKRDSRVKNTMEFVNCVVFVRESSDNLSAHTEFPDTNWHFYAIGNIGDAKVTDDTRVNDPDDPNEFVLEISDNTLPNAVFQTGVNNNSYPIASSQWVAGNTAYDNLYNNWDGSFEFRYSKSGISSSQKNANKQVWRDFYEWVITSSDSDFVSQLGNWFIEESAYYYYVFTLRYTMMDNRAKNTFWHWGKVYITESAAEAMGDDAQNYIINNAKATINNGYRFEMWDYDNDTALGINNSGTITFPYGKEDTDLLDSTYVFNGAKSTFFCRLRDLCASRLKSMYSTVSSASGGTCWSAENLISEYTSWQNKFPEELWRLDIERKYYRPFTDLGNQEHLEKRMNGRKKYQMRQFERDQEVYMGTKFQLPAFEDENIMIRCTTPETTRTFESSSSASTYLVSSSAEVGQYVNIKESGNYVLYVILKDANDTLYYTRAVDPNYDLTITPYTDMYINIKYGNTAQDSTTVQVRAVAGQTYTIECPLDSMSDTMALISAAPHIQALGDISACYVRDTNFSRATRLQSLIIGNHTNGYKGALTSLTINNLKMLRELDIYNCSKLTSSVNLSQCINLEEFDAGGSSISGVIFADNGKLQETHLPATIKTIELRNLRDITNFDVDSYDALEELVVEYSAIDTLEIVSDAYDTLTKLRLKGIEWTFSGATAAEKATNAIALLDAIYPLADSVLEGTINMGQVKERDRTKYIDNKWGVNLVLSGTFITQYQVTFIDDGNNIIKDRSNTSYVQWVDRGQKAYDPTVAQTGQSVSDVAIPTKATDEQYTYTFDHWEVYDGSSTSGTAYTFNVAINAPITLKAIFTATMRTYTVRWYTADVADAYEDQVTNDGIWDSSKAPISARTLLHEETDVAYGSALSFTNPTQRKCVKDTTAEKITAYNFIAWDKFTDFVNDDLDVYAIYRYASATYDSDGKPEIYNTNSLQKTLDEMNSAEVQIVCATGYARDSASNAYFADKDYFDYTLGIDYTFKNVRESTIVSLDNPRLVEGDAPFFATDVDDPDNTPIKLFAEDSPSFTMVIDFQFSNDKYNYQPENEKTLVSCFANPGNGNDGFRLRYLSNRNNILWGDKNTTFNAPQDRDIVVIRHTKGSPTLNIRSFNGGSNTNTYYQDSQFSTSLTRTNAPASGYFTDAPLVFGGISEYDDVTGEYVLNNTDTYFGAGVIHWCKIWYADLGDDTAQQLASWTREQQREEFYTTSTYKLKRSDTLASASFMANNALYGTHRMNSDNTNSGGWGGNTSTDAKYQASMHYFLQNRYLNAIPNEWRVMIAEVDVPSTVGGGSSNWANYPSYVYIPAYGELFGTSTEGSIIPWLPNNTSGSVLRARFRGVTTMTSRSYQLPAGTTTYNNQATEPIVGQGKGLYNATTNPTGVKEYETWTTGNNATVKIYLSERTIQTLKLTPANAITVDGVKSGGWVSASWYWTRSPGTGNTYFFWYCADAGAANNYYYADYWSGVAPCFSIYANLTTV